MKKIFMLSFANIRKTKAHTVTLLLLFLIAALLLNAGMLVLTNFNGFFEKTTKELNTSNTYYAIPTNFYSDKVNQYIKNNHTILKMQKENSMRVSASIRYNGDQRDQDFLFYDADANRSLSKWKFVGQHLPADSMSIYVPYVMSVDGGYKLNDTIKFKIKDVELAYTIKGFTEDALFSSLDTGALGVYLPHDTYEKAAQKLGKDYGMTMVFANLLNKNNKIDTEIKDLIKSENPASNANIDSAVQNIDLSLIRMSRVLMASMISVMTVAFAVIIAIVCLVVVKFRIGNSIEEDMQKIGSLKAIGYTSRQIINSVVLQFLLIAFVGSIAGILFSYLTTPVLSSVFVHQSGLKWVQGFDPVVSSIVLFSILVVVLLVSLFPTRRIHKINPITALRGGIVTHNFRKNHIPLDKSKGSLPFVLAFKSIVQNKKQSIMIGLILTFVAFASAFSVVMFYNTTVDTATFARTPGIEISDAVVAFKPGSDNTKAVQDIKSRSGVRKAQFIDNVTVAVNGKSVMTYVMDDYAQKETQSICEGRYPLHSNEIALAGTVASLINKNIGDTVTVKANGKQADYIITGLTQGSNMGGLNASIRTDGMMRMNPDYKHQTLQIYLKKGVKSAQFVKDLEPDYEKTTSEIADADKEFAQAIGVYTSIISKVGIATLVINIAVVLLVLYFVINSSVIRKKRELGIQKAVGFTTLQLMNQISLSFLPSITIGVVIGSILGITQTNAVMTVAQHSMNIMKASYIITPGWIALVGAAIIAVSYLTSMLITFKIRKISAYKLVCE
ncbi:MAG TPA: ABC transporter permease [Oscillospiraceae bacterium]|nr:ABC transporter permease [Oscillospiraceae bacterium]